MATLVPLTMREGNDERIYLTVTPDDPTENLTGLVALEVLLKPDACAGSTDAGVLLLSSTDPAEITILTQTATLVTAYAYVPASALVGAYKRFWRADGLTTTTRRTALYGPVTVIDL